MTKVSMIAERVIWTAVQAGIAAVPVQSAVAAATAHDYTALQALGLTALGASVASLLSLAKNLTTGGGPSSPLERIGWTFLQGALGSIAVVNAAQAIAGKNVSTLESILWTALGAGITAALSAAKHVGLGQPSDG